MTAERIRDVVASLDGRLDDVAREQAWRGIERSTLDAPADGDAVRRRWWRALWIGVPVLAATAIALIVVAGRAPSRTASPPAPPTELVAEAGRRSVFERDGVTLTLHGPGAATVTGHADGTIQVRVTRGTLIADRRDDAPAVAIAARDNTTTTRDRRFAVRVEPTMVVLGAGAEADQIVERFALERHVLIETPPPAPMPEPVLEPTPRRPFTTPPPSSPPPADDPPPPPPPIEPAPQIALDAADLYRRAEAALARGDRVGARRLLEQLIRDHPGRSLVDAARYDLALIARADGDDVRARTLLDQIVAGDGDPAVRAAASRLRATMRTAP